MRSTRTAIEGAGIAFILVIGAIHAIDAPGSFGDATYKGILFVANAVGALVAAVGIARRQALWGWGLGVAIAAGAFVGYIISRTVGLPGIPPDVWLEPLGILSLLVEPAFIVVFLLWRRTPPAGETQAP